MKLSLMVINLMMDIFLNKDFTPKVNPDINEYDKVLKLVHDAGYVAVDMTNMECECFGTPKVKALMAKHGLSCASMIHFDNYTCVDQIQQANMRKSTEKVVINAADLGCQTIMLVAAGAQQGLSRKQLQQGLVENLSAAVAIAAEKGVTICIEDFPSTDVPMCSSADVKYLLDNVKGLKLTYDSANMLVEDEDAQEYYEIFKKQIGYCHLKDVRMATEKDLLGDAFRDGRKMITTHHGKGIIDLGALVGWLKRDGYKGYLSVEYAKDGVDENLLEILVDERIYLEGLIN